MKKLLLSILFLILFLVLIFLVKTVDVRTVAVTGEKIGLSGINQGFHRMTGISDNWYWITQILGIFALFVAAGFGVLGLVQLIKRHDITRVDFEILSLGGLYLVTIGLYLLFEKLVVNYRPIIMPDNQRAEASFPSSHTVLVCIVMGAAVILAGKYLKNRCLRLGLQVLCVVIAVVTFVGRLLSGVHWLTDILGGILLSGALLSAYLAVLSLNTKEKKKGD